MNGLKILLDKDMRASLDRARKDERERCEVEQKKALSRLRESLEQEHELERVEFQSKIASIELRMKNIDKREKDVQNQSYKNKVTAIKQRRVISDFAHILKSKQEEEAEDLQMVLALTDDSDTIERELIGR
jgi:hypothetical protein